MSKTHISIEQAQRDISDLLKRVAHHGERIVLTSGGKPLAALVSMDDYQQLEQADQRQARWQAWLAESDKLAADIMERRGGEPLDLDAVWQAVRADQEARDDQIIGG
jgi:prevent-host-death family protein